MLYREIIVICSQIHKKTNTLCGQNVGLLNVKLVVHIVTTGLYKVKNEWHVVSNALALAIRSDFALSNEI